MGRFHRHSDGTVHEHDHQHDDDQHHDDQHHDDQHHDDHEHHLLGDRPLDPEADSGRDVGDHSGYATGDERVMVLENILSENDRIAAENRALFAEHGIRVVNVMSSPGAGKTTLLRSTIPPLAATRRVAVVEGDIATGIDADQLRGLGAQVALVNTGNGFGGECHLDAVMVRAGLDQLDLTDVDTLIIENVGNLVCPAEFDVGQHERAMVYSLTEGEEKPLKYPVMFRAADVVVVNKMDLAPHLDADLDAFRSNLGQVNPDADVVELSAKTGEGLDAWIDWLR